MATYAQIVKKIADHHNAIRFQKFLDDVLKVRSREGGEPE